MDIKNSLVFLCLMAFFLATAQERPLPDPEACFTAVIVADMDTSLEWYSGVLGFQLVNQQASEERGYRISNLQRGAVMLELLELKSALAPKTAIPGYSNKTLLQGFFKTGYLLSDFDSWISYLKSKGVEFRGEVVTDPISGKKMAIIKDPDGNRIQLFEK